MRYQKTYPTSAKDWSDNTIKSYDECINVILENFCLSKKKNLQTLIYIDVRKCLPYNNLKVD